MTARQQVRAACCDMGGLGLVTDEQKRRERGHAVGLFRYQLICPALDSGLSTKARGRLVLEIAARQHTDPFGTAVKYSRDTLDRWIRRYRAGGFEELVPSVRALSPRTDSVTLELAAALKRENPARTAAQVQRILRASAGWSPSESTLLRHFHRLERGASRYLLLGRGGLQQVVVAPSSAGQYDRFTADRCAELIGELRPRRRTRGLHPRLVRPIGTTIYALYPN